MAVAGRETVNVSAKPHQPLNFEFPKHSFGKKNAVERSFQHTWFAQWPFLHYDEAKDAAFCHTCLMGFHLRNDGCGHM